MNSEQTLIDLLDQYVKGTLRAEERVDLENKMLVDSTFREKVEKHVALVNSLKFYEGRKALKQKLDEAHLEIEVPSKKISPNGNLTTLKRFWPALAVAASLALIGIVGTFLMTHQLDTKQTAIYKELRRNVEQIKKSQKMMMEDIAVAKVREKPLPGNYAGTGFLVSSNGYVATSYHVIKEADSVVIENENFGRLKTSVVYSDAQNDIAILKIEQVNFEVKQSIPYMVSKIEASLAEDVYTLGYPREDIVFGEGAISALTGFKQNPNAYQISVPVNPGNSGGPLLNSKGDLIGIISGIQTETAGAAFAIKSTIISDAIATASLDTLSAPLILPKQNTLKASNRVQQVKRWKDFVFIVRVYKTN